MTSAVDKLDQQIAALRAKPRDQKARLITERGAK
jgi:hypothetical protein